MSASRIQWLWEKAKKDPKRVVLPEGNDVRVLQAAEIIGREKIAKAIVLGNKAEVEKLAKANSIKLDNVEIIQPELHPRFEEIVNTYYELRKHKGITLDDARKDAQTNLINTAALMARLGMADGFVSGAVHATADIARASIYFLKIDRAVGIVCSCFVVELENCPFGENGLFIYGDCGIIPDPSSNQLAGISVACGNLMEKLFDVKARVALLSYSTKGSAKGESIDKVTKAIPLIKEKAPNLMVDGELQGDAALVPEVAKRKAPDSDVAGKANVLIFPNLDAGNICYKLTQRLAKARVIGPILLGPTIPASDLSRGCGVEEIVDAVAVTAVRAQGASS